MPNLNVVSDTVIYDSGSYTNSAEYSKANVGYEKLYDGVSLVPSSGKQIIIKSMRLECELKVQASITAKAKLLINGTGSDYCESTETGTSYVAKNEASAEIWYAGGIDETVLIEVWFSAQASNANLAYIQNVVASCVYIEA